MSTPKVINSKNKENFKVKIKFNGPTPHEWVEAAKKAGWDHVSTNTPAAVLLQKDDFRLGLSFNMEGGRYLAKQWADEGLRGDHYAAGEYGWQLKDNGVSLEDVFDRLTSGKWEYVPVI